MNTFPKKFTYSKNCFKKKHIVQGQPWGKNPASDFYYSGLVFDYKRFQYKLRPAKKSIDHTQLKGGIKHFMPHKIPTLPTPVKNLMAPPP